MNPVIGDKALDGILAAGSALTEVDKVRCHVSYALSELKNKTTKDQTSRADLLAKLESYIENGIFPCNENAASPCERFPCFIDSFGTPCAVAHLMQQSGASSLAAAIATAHKYGSIADIAADAELLPKIEAWAATVGLNVIDLALIQPTYPCVAQEALELFERIEAKFQKASSAPSCMSESEKHQFANLIVRFGDMMVSGGGYPKRHIPYFLRRIKKLQRKVSKDKKEIHIMLNVLVKEAESKDRGKPEDYEGLLSPEDLAFMKESLISNWRVPHSY